MITLYAFGKIFPEGIGETKDLWVQWALEETRLPYEVQALDHGAGDLDAEAYLRISPFGQVPVIEDDGFALAESGAIALYLADKSGKLIPSHVQGRARVVQWTFAAVATVGTTLVALDLIGMFDPRQEAKTLQAEVPKIAERWLGHLERRLEGRTWIATDEFTVADLMMASELRAIRNNGRMAPFPQLRAYYERCTARPAWQKTLAMYAERLGVEVDTIR